MRRRLEMKVSTMMEGRNRKGGSIVVEGRHNSTAGSMLGDKNS